MRGATMARLPDGRLHLQEGPIDLIIEAFGGGIEVERVAENCEPALCTVLFMAGAGGSLRAGVTENPVRLTRSVRDALTKVTLGGAPAFVWPGGGITLMVDVARMPEKSFGYVPTPALVAPIEFTLRADDYAALGGYTSRAVTLEDAIARAGHVRLDKDER